MQERHDRRQGGRGRAGRVPHGADGFTKTMRDGLVPRDVFELAVRERDAYRKARPIAK